MHRLFSKFARIGQTRRQFGWLAAARQVVDGIGRRLFRRRAIEIVWLALANLPLELPEGEHWSFRKLTAKEVAEYALDPANDLDHEMIERIIRRGDVCFAALDGHRLAAYGWYARHGIEPEHCFGFGLEYPDDVAYMYKGFTHNDYRGRRLHGIAMGLALQDLHRDGVDSLVSSIDWTNAASIRSCRRLGYEFLGLATRWSFLGRTHMSVPPAAVARGVRFFSEDDAPTGARVHGVQTGEMVASA